MLSLIALVMASAGTGYAALGDGGGAVTAGNARGEPVEIELRNRSRGETGLVTASDGYSLRLSNTQEGGGGGAVYGCRAPDAPPGDNVACLYADNLRGGKAFLFRSQEGPTVGHFDLGNPAGAPFTTNATGLVTNLNADKVDGLDASQLQGQTGPQGSAGPQGPAGPAGATGPPGPTVSAEISTGTNVTLSGIETTVAQTTITLPFAGRILATGVAEVDGDGGGDDEVYCFIDPGTDPQIGSRVTVSIPDAASDTVGVPVAGSVEKPAGTYTMRLRCGGIAGTTVFTDGDLIVWATPA
ncbi:MAG: hypothetical protein WD844_06195 [Thermoleophilaceae bacterium]